MKAPIQFGPVDQKAFILVWQAVVASVERKLVVLDSFIGKAVSFQDGTEIKILDTPVSRALAGVIEALGPKSSTEERLNYGVRVGALISLLRSGALSAFVQRDPKGQPLIPSVLLEHAAEAPVTSRGFNAKAFVRGVKQKMRPRPPKTQVN